MKPCTLCEGCHPIHLCPYMDEATTVLDNPIASVSCLLVGYQKLSLSPPLVDSTISQHSSLADPAPSKIQNHESIPNQPLVEESAYRILPMVHQVFSVESGSHTPYVLLVSSYSSKLEKDLPVSMVQEVASPIPTSMVQEDAPLAPVTQSDDHIFPMVPLPSSLVASFDWSRFAGYRLPSYVPFEITVQAFNVVIPSMIIDEGTSISIMSSTTWKALVLHRLCLLNIICWLLIEEPVNR